MAGLQQTNQQIQQLSNRLDQLQASLDCWAKRSQTEYSGKAPSSSSNNLLVAITLLVLFLLATAGVLFYREYAHVPNVVPLVQNPLPQNTALARQPLVTFPEYTETLVAEETPMPIEEAQASAPEPPPSESQPTIAEETPNSSETQSAIVEETPIVKTQEKAQVEVEPAIPAMEEANASEPKEDAEAAESLTPVMTPETQLSETAREPNHSIIQPMNGYFSL
ncbi:MAG: hypothetical protein HYU33_01940 [Candidatus Omnitrophica bacterium]|nr:hypothetical protein [Candidatus Omnitrophota bacterium]MBI3010369.1 hypothetical protein [Candidatus Omnitrophota bacterium]